MKDSLSQSHISARRTDGSYLKNFYQSVQKRRQEGRGGGGGGGPRMAIPKRSKRFAFHPNTIIIVVIITAAFKFLIKFK